MDTEVIGKRDMSYELQFLQEAERIASLGRSDWAEKVEQRLIAMNDEKGEESYLDLSLSRMVHEIDQESLDLGGWPVLAALLSQRMKNEEDAYNFRMLLLKIAAHGVMVHELCRQAKEILED